MSIANDVRVSDELKLTAMGFGELIRQVGTAVATTTRELTTTGARSITSLATTQVNVIAAEEIVYDDHGMVSEHKAYQQSLPLINFVDPVIYQWSNVRVQGVFFAQELSTATRDSYKAHQNKYSDSQGGLLVIFGGGSNQFTASSTSGTTQSLHEEDSSVGAMRLFAHLEPRYDVGVPKPTQVTVGPVIHMLLGPVDRTTKPDFPTAVLVIEYRSATGAPIKDKVLSIDAEGLTWAYKDPTKTATDANGALSITLTRDLSNPQADKSAASFIVTARKGLVATSVAVRL